MSKFTDAIEHNWPGHTIACGAAACCDICLSAFGLDEERDLDKAQEQMYEQDEGHFSWEECDSCGSRLGGNRHYAHALPYDTDEIVHIEICTDCLMFHANGDEPEDWGT